jgi:hypothetical protein
MTGHAATYSIIRFCPDVARGEGVNVGVVLICPAVKAVRVLLSSNNERVKKHFGKASFDDARLTAAKRALARRLSSISPAQGDLRAFISQESGSLTFDEPRPIVVSEVEADMAALFAELVGEVPRLQRRREVTPEVEQYFLPLFTANVPIQRNVTVSVPKLGRELHVPYAYRNGAINYIKPQGFGPDQEATLRIAQNLGSQGFLIQKHPQGEMPEQLIVIGAFRQPSHLPAVREMFEDFKVRLVVSDEIMGLVEEIRRQAHD